MTLVFVVVSLLVRRLIGVRSIELPVGIVQEKLKVVAFAGSGRPPVAVLR